MYFFFLISTDFGETFNETNQDIYEGNIRKNDGLQRSPVDPNMVRGIFETNE